jgi:serine/threonine-protein kinase
MSANRYAPPKSEVEVRKNDLSYSVPDEVLKKIKHAWTAGLISAALTLLVTLLAVFGVKMMGFDAWEFLDVAFILGLTYGIYRKSRVCAVLMLVYFLISKIIIFAQSGKPNGIVMAVVFLYYYAQGVAGTFAYHKHVHSAGAGQQTVS